MNDDNGPQVPETSQHVVDIGEDIKKTLRILVVATCILYVCFVIGAVIVWNNSKSNTHALCAIRDEAAARVADSTQFLTDHPAGFAGVSPAEIQKGINDSTQTVTALSGLDC